MSLVTNVSLNPDLNGYYAAPAGAAGVPGIVVIMEAFGLTPHIRGVCDRLAAAGFAALAPDIYHGRYFEYSDWDNGARPALQSMKDDQVMNEVGASLDFLAARPEVDAGKLGVTGFCMGGRFAFLSNCRHSARLKATVAFYGGGIAPEGAADIFGRAGPIREAAAMKAPLLMIYGGEDPLIDIAEHARIVKTLGDLKKDYTLTLYPEGTHGFCCEHRDGYHVESATAAYAEAIDYFRRAFAG